MHHPLFCDGEEYNLPIPISPLIGGRPIAHFFGISNGVLRNLIDLNIGKLAYPKRILYKLKEFAEV